MASRPTVGTAPAGKGITIKTLKKSTAANDDYIEATWRVLSDFVEAVYALSSTRHSFQELYGACESACTSGRGQLIYERLRTRVAQQLSRQIAELVSHTADASSFLAAVAHLWGVHEQQVVMLRSVFVYLDTTYVRDAAHASSTSAAAAGARLSGEAALPTLPLRDLGVWLLHREFTVTHSQLVHRIVDAFCSQVNTDRSGEVVDRAMLSAVCRMFISMRLYETHLRPALVVAARDYYESEGAARQASMDVPHYLVHVEDRIRQERERVLTYMDAFTTLKAVLTALESQLLARHAASLLERGFAQLMSNALSRLADLRRFYVLLSRAGKVAELRKHFIEFARRQSLAIVANPDNNEEKDKAMVADLLAWKATMDATCTQAFGGSDTFTSAVTTALEEAVNSRENKPAELIAKFVDAKMRSGTRGGAASASASSSVTAAAAASSSTPTAAGAAGSGIVAADEDLDEVLARVMTLFRCIHGKDVFEAFYKKDLAKRLLLGRSASTDTEKAMVARLKTECGSAFTSKLEGMFKDADSSAELMRQFTDGRHGDALPFDLHVHVLTSSYWPAYTPMRVTLPPALAAGLDVFASFYLHKFSKGRVLSWQHSLGHCILRADFPAGRKELDVSFFQTLVLLLFNDADALPFTRIRDATGIEDGELRRTLQSLALGQVRVLRKDAKGKDVADADVFAFNADFRAALIRLKINSIQMKETKAETDATHEQVIADRQYQVDAAVVRIMKARKSMTHTALLTELFPMLRFPAKSADIKTRIESLMEREYLERDEDDPNTYNYVA